MIDIRLPNITGTTPEAKISQLQSYLHQLVEQLNMSLNTLDGLVPESKSTVIAASDNANSTKQDALATFNEIKTLIIKSSDIISAYEKQLRKTFDGEYVAESDFGEYKETTKNTIEADSKKIELLLSSVQAIQSEIDSLNSSSIVTSGWIKTGQLGTDNDGVPIIGVEVGKIAEVDGKTTIDRYARFISGRIEFFPSSDANEATSWLSATTVHSTNAEFSGYIKMNGYQLDLSDGVAFKWIGGAQ